MEQKKASRAPYNKLQRHLRVGSVGATDTAGDIWQERERERRGGEPMEAEVGALEDSRKKG